MRTVMRNLSESQMREIVREQITSRRQEGDRLYEQLMKRPNFGGKSLEEAYKKAPDRVRNLAFAIKNQEAHLATLTEAQISSTFHTTPDNVLRVLRLGYLNTARQECFWEMGLTTARDVFYWLEPKYGKALRGAKKGDVMYESSDWRSATDVDVYEVNETANGTIKDFTVTGGNVHVAPISRFTVRVIVNGEYVASDDGAGNLKGDSGVSGKINMETGDTELSFAAAPASGTVIEVEMGVALEKDEDLEITQHVDLSLRVTPFTMREFPIYASFTKKSELLIGTTLDIDAEEAYLRAMADELKKSLDFQAFHMGYKQAKRNAAVHGTTVFNLNGAVGESEHERVQVIDRYLDKAGNTFYNELLRGGITRLYGGTDATGVFKAHKNFVPGNQSQQGIYHFGTVNGIEIFRTPNSIVPHDTLVGMYKNPEVPEDVFLMIGTLVPLHVTDKLERANRVTEFGVASYGDMQILNRQYATLIRIDNT